jgi:hypothetical protein
MRLTQKRLVGLAFRATSPRYSDLHKTAAMSRLYPGRFNSADVGAVYVSREPETAMGAHASFTVATGVQVYFCDPRSPWQRGTNENSNGLLRQYFPKGTALAGYSQAQLTAVAMELNARPRQTLGWDTPSEAFARVVAMTA